MVVSDFKMEIKLNIDCLFLTQYCTGICFRLIDTWVNKDGFVEEEKVRQWFESILTMCLNEKSQWEDSGYSYQVLLYF